MQSDLSDIGADGRLRHEVPAHMALRILLVVFGAFIVGIAINDLWRGVWPPNLFSLPFGVILAGAVTVGGGIAMAGLFGPSHVWTVAPGAVEVTSATPFTRQQRTFTSAQIAGFSIREIEGDQAPSVWSVVLHTQSGERFESRAYQSRAAAQALRDRIEALLRA